MCGGARLPSSLTPLVLAPPAVLTVVAGLALAGAYAVLVRRSIARMDVDLKRTRATLLLFPSDVLACVATFLQSTGGGSVGVVPAVVDAELDGGGV